MPKFINKTQAAALAQIEAALPEGTDLSAALEAEGGLTALLTPDPLPAEPAEPTEAQASAIVADFFASQGVALEGEATAEDSLAALIGAQESFGIVADAMTAHGIDLNAVAADEDPAAALSAAVEQLAQKKAVSIAASAGAAADDLPETPEGEPSNAPKTEAEFLTAIAQADNSAEADSLYTQMRAKFPRQIN